VYDASVSVPTKLPYYKFLTIHQTGIYIPKPSLSFPVKFLGRMGLQPALPVVTYRYLQVACIRSFLTVEMGTVSIYNEGGDRLHYAANEESVHHHRVRPRVTAFAQVNRFRGEIRYPREGAGAVSSRLSTTSSSS
jgi:hypothetical protein